MKAKTIWPRGDSQRSYACQCIAEAPVGYVVKIGEETRRDAQNRKLHPMIKDIRQQNAAMGAFTADEVKLRFLNALGMELKFLPTLEGAGAFPVGPRSSTLTVQQFSGLIEILYEWGARNGIEWTDPTTLRNESEST